MLGKNIAIKGIITTILLITLGFSQLSLEIQNVDLDAGTLEIFMKNTAGCSYCTDPTYTEESHCILYGSVNNNGVVDATWEFSTDLDEATCELEATNGVYFNGKVGGFQFQLLGATIDLASGGSAEDNGFNISAQAETYNADTDKQLPNILAFSLTGATIPAGSNSLLTRVTFTTFSSSGICFGEDTGSAGANTISDEFGGYIAADWGDCYCESASPADCAGVCGGDSVLSGCDDACNSTAVVDCAGVCDGDSVLSGCDNACNSTAVIDCADDCGGSAIFDSDGNCITLAISQISYYLPAEFSISQNFPNPFNPVTSITFDVAEMDEVSLIVYDLTGKEVATLVSGIYAPGTYNLEWNAVNNSGDGIVSGMYIYRYISSEKAITRKMLYLK